MHLAQKNKQTAIIQLSCSGRAQGVSTAQNLFGQTLILFAINIETHFISE